MKRREFIKTSAKVGTGTFILNNIPLRTFATPPFSCTDIQNRVLVLVNMFGANDTLNTVVPVSQYNIYANNRQSIKIPSTGANAYITLNPSATNPTALHPVLTPFKSLYDAGKLNIIHGVGYANNNKSHFKSDDLFSTAGDSTAANFSFDSGWAGQLFEARFPGLLSNSAITIDPPCIELGATNGSLMFNSSLSNNASILLTNSNLSTYYDTLVSVGGPTPTTFPNSDYGDELKYISEIQNETSIYSNRIQTIFNNGSNSSVAYDANSSLANQLKTVARLIKGGAKTQIYLVHQFGFDTHADQVVSGSPTIGAHADLLSELSTAIKAFQDDITALNIGDKVLTATYSEFGRTIDQNSASGTDHGGVSTMFIIGNGVNGKLNSSTGITGTPIDLTKVVSRGLTDLQYDYRNVWSTLLQDFLANDNGLINISRMGNYINNKLPIVAPDYISPSSCYVSKSITSPLPIKIVDFTVSLLPDFNAMLNWSTSSEINCHHFEIFYSTNSFDWNSIGLVKGSGTTNSTKNYSLLHDKPKIGINYYRLHQFDIDGKETIFNIITLLVNESSEINIKLYPIPAKFDFNVVVNSDKDIEGKIILFDIQGHLLNKKIINVTAGFNKFNFLVSDLKNYIGEILVHIELENGFNKTVKQIIIS